MSPATAHLALQPLRRYTVEETRAQALRDQSPERRALMRPTPQTSEPKKPD